MHVVYRVQKVGSSLSVFRDNPEIDYFEFLGWDSNHVSIRQLVDYDLPGKYT